MSIAIYKPNAKNEGCACSFSIGQDGIVFINAVQQFSWDEASKKGSFAENAKNKDKSVAVKLNEWEIGGLINAIDKVQEYKMFHKFEDNQTSINFTVWEKKDNTKAFGLSITRNSTDKFRLPIEMTEAQVIKYFLIFALNMRFHAEEKARKSA